MALCWPSLILLICAFVVHASSSTYNLTPELTNFIPVCAQDCFISFLQSNFPTELCSTTPTLDCLCSHNSTTGYTVGEGAVQCLISEVNIGFCQGEDSQDAVIVDAYSMCNGQTSALPNTHATITATLVIETSMPSIVLVASVAASTTELSSAAATQSSAATSTQTSTATSTPSVLPSTLITTTRSPSGPSSSTTSSRPTSSSTSATTTTPLSKPAVVGIAVGSAAAIGIALLVLICLRRRKQRQKRDSDMLPFQMDPNSRIMKTSRYSHNLHRSFKRGPGGTPSGVAAKVHRIPPPIPLRLDTSPPHMFSRRTIRPEEREPEPVGFAISPATPAISQGERTPHRSSRLLPEKPNLKLAVPPPVAVKTEQQPRQNSMASRQNSMASRQSTVTTFEEDEESATTPGYSGNWSPRMPITVPIPVPTKISNTQAPSSRSQPVKSQPKPPTFFVDDPEEEMEIPKPKPPKMTSEGQESQAWRLNVGRGISFSQPRRPAALPAPKLGFDTSLQVPAPPKTVSNTSSLYSIRGSSIASSTSSLNPDNNAMGRKSYQVIGPYDAQNQISNASFTSLETDNDYEPIITHVRELSPVVESPASGTSPVQYPKIPMRLSGTAMFGERPRQPDYNRALDDVMEERHSQLQQYEKAKPVADPPQYQEKEKEPENRDTSKVAEIEVRKERRASRQLSKTQLQPLPSLGHMTTFRPQHARQPSEESSKILSPGPPPYSQGKGLPTSEKDYAVEIERAYTPTPTPAVPPRARTRAPFSFQLPPTPPSTVSPTPKKQSSRAMEGIHVITSHFQTDPTPVTMQRNRSVRAAASTQNPTPTTTPAPTSAAGSGSGLATRYQQPLALSSEPTKPASTKQKLHVYTGVGPSSPDYTSPPPTTTSATKNYLSTLPSQKGSSSRAPLPYQSPHGFHPVTTVKTSQFQGQSTGPRDEEGRPLTDATGGFSIFPSTSPYTQNPPLPFNLLTHSPLSPKQQIPQISPIEQAQRNLRLENETKYPIRSSSKISTASKVSTSSKTSTSSSLLAKRRGETKASELVLKSSVRDGKRASDSKGKGRGSPSKWRVLKQEDIEVAKRGDWKPMATVDTSPRLSSPGMNTGRRAEMGSGSPRSYPNQDGMDASSSSTVHLTPNAAGPSRGPALRRIGNLREDFKQNQSEGLTIGLRGHQDSQRVRHEVQIAGYTLEREELPATPGWEPHLTPTRRGEELILSVR